ncbi:conserved hypothetical protein [Lodderomyces elongisporus NRRL YB-4239]|uniref:Cap-associated protein CAF20 n=1 Tax=Lodderomyces elongisporus (strain ATCC 11503 / CBS 2605 / JCM 1781 / NBRC 1676 / NRRL YB-4239) TaxID=379508 RepID=CAF20_LODEL|nr:RecName: Full=Cap-associated protein CAF20 [Lodderomyces elongisporus NRRL YB-4239]EDK42501.1 conserved hypothetical protein [Lodderomyces elongisporus NRRL YB-4239]
MAKYTEEQLFAIKEETSYVPQPQILSAFNELIEQVKEHAHQQQLQYQQQQQQQQGFSGIGSGVSGPGAQKWRNGDTYIDEHGHERSYHHMNRRRPSRSNNGEKKPFFNKKKTEVVVDEDGWETFTPVQHAHRGSIGEDGSEEKSKFRDSVSGSSGSGAGAGAGAGAASGSAGGVRARPNNKNLGSSKQVDPRQIASTKQTRTFNAFEALEGNDDEDDDE